MEVVALFLALRKALVDIYGDLTADLFQDLSRDSEGMILISLDTAARELEVIAFGDVDKRNLLGEGVVKG